MPRSRLPLCLLTLSLFCLPQTTFASSIDGRPKVLIHLATKTTKNACGTRGTVACDQVKTAGALYPNLYFGYLMVAGADAGPGVGGLQCGIQYDAAATSGIDIFSWTLCATLEFVSTGWPNSGGGNLITWDTATKCQRFEPGGAGTGVSAAAGYFYMAAYTPDMLRVTPRPVDGRAKLADCASNEMLLVSGDLGSANFTSAGNVPGVNSCLATGGSTGLVARASLLGVCAPGIGESTKFPILINQPTVGALVPVHAISVDIQLGPSYMLSGSAYGEGDYFSGTGPTLFGVVDKGAGRYSIDCSLLGLPCSTTNPAGALAYLEVQRIGASLSPMVTLLGARARDCANKPLTIGVEQIDSFDTTPPAAITNLGATQRRTGNSTSGVTKIQLSFSPPADAFAVEVYRAPFGGYPVYDELGGATPALPAYPPSAPWQLTAVHASGDFDEPADRDAWYYVAFCKDPCGNVSSVSNMTAPQLNYHLGDVTTAGNVLCTGDNRVDNYDAQLYRSLYGTSVPPGDPRGCLDIGPTLDGTALTRPLTDGQIDFEDAVIFSLNYAAVSAPFSPPPGSSPDRLTLEVNDAAADEIVAHLAYEGSGAVRALGVNLKYDEDELEVLRVERGAFLDGGRGDYLLAAHAADLAVCRLDTGPGLAGAGELARVVLHRLRPGPGTLHVLAAQARNALNQPVDIEVVESGASSVGVSPSTVPPTGIRVVSRIIQAQVAAGESVHIDVFDMLGRHVRQLYQGQPAAGAVELRWDERSDAGTRIAAGLYLVRLKSARGSWSARYSVIR